MCSSLGSHLSQCTLTLCFNVAFLTFELQCDWLPAWREQKACRNTHSHFFVAGWVAGRYALYRFRKALFLRFIYTRVLPLRVLKEWRNKSAVTLSNLSKKNCLWSTVLSSWRKIFRRDWSKLLYKCCCCNLCDWRNVQMESLETTGDPARLTLICVIPCLIGKIIAIGHW